MDVTERNAIVEQCQNMVWWTINQNRRLINALRIEEDDVFQDLVIVLIRAVEDFDPEKGGFSPHILSRLQYRILTYKHRNKPHGITKRAGAQLEFMSVDYIYEDGPNLEIPFEADFSGPEMEAAFAILSPDEYEALMMQLDGFHLRKKVQKTNAEQAKAKLAKFYQFSIA